MCTFLALWLGARALRRGRLAVRARLRASRPGRLPGAARSHPRPVRDRADLARRPRPRAATARLATALPALVALLRLRAGRGRLVCRWSKARSPRSSRSGSRPRSARSTQTLRRAPQQLPRGLDDPRWDFSPKEEAERIPIHGTGERRGPDRRQVVGRAVLALRGHDRLGPGAPAVHSRPLPRSRPGRLRRDRAPAACSSSRPSTRWPWCGTACCSAISRAGTSWRLFTPRFPGPRRAASSAAAESRSSCAGADSIAASAAVAGRHA